MLVAVLMIFVVFSFTGVAVLNVSYISTVASTETINNIKLQYAMESSVNESLWRMNNGPDSLINVEADGITTLFDPVLNVLSVKVDKFQMETEILLDLSEDTHFDRALASDETINTNGNDVDADEENQSRFFSFMPEVDLDYFTDNAVAIHTENFHRWDGGGKHEDDEDFDEGIHVFTGSFLEFKKMHLYNHTLVFTGRYILFSDDNEISAPVPVDSADALPALVFSNSDSYFEIEAEGKNYDKEDKINGAIYTAGTIILKKGELSGPIVGKTITMEHGEEYNNQIDFKDTEHPKHYRWTKGFKNKKHYDWPKQIGRWKTKKWKKKHHA
ncbi:MAG: hypothetical protein HN995_00530 [Candidatus Marinimicrobia bacterium]|jgi:hypothetical protein|nr:hypothetical protein [Candidatus Neomarinimicrobiota bacterium]MBT3680698.1 hypothetical protein [Candidatus Neomarinimicrobiota bacterium]MBT3950362.1 hypothetical protein [Candidatus Neomarinimicrobiota bacterium]MBT4251692.1 hypothetical protein [Candidatus Neomarinimicrobiota bacterium]MBT4479586.1 hypothetical protein [Candidatus Neomarinimicrobiota bacterium]